MRRYVAVWLLLFGVYASTIGIPQRSGRDYAGSELHYLLAADSIVHDGDIDLRNQYRHRAYTSWAPVVVAQGRLTGGHVHEPRAAGLSLLLAPAYALGGARLAEWEMAAIAALAFTLAAALARMLVPEPWATGGALTCGLSPPALAYATTIYPELVAGAILAGSALLALRARERPRAITAVVAAVALAFLPWLGLKYVPAGAIVLVALARWLRRRQRGLFALIAGEIGLVSLVVYVTVDGRLYGGLTPYAAVAPGRSATGADSLGDYLSRAWRIVGLWLDRDAGLLRWAPFLALAFVGLWLLWRSRRDRLARAVSDQIDVEVAAGLLAAVSAAVVAVAVFVAPAAFDGWFPGRQLVAAIPVAAPLCAWAMRRLPRTGTALAVLTLAESAWLYAYLRLGHHGWLERGDGSPWGGVQRVLPDYATGTTASRALTAALTAAAVLLVVREWRRHRRPVALAAD